MWEIYDKIFLGNRASASDPYTIQQYHISHVVNATADLKNYFEDMTSVDHKQLIRRQSQTFEDDVEEEEDDDEEDDDDEDDEDEEDDDEEEDDEEDEDFEGGEDGEKEEAPVANIEANVETVKRVIRAPSKPLATLVTSDLVFDEEDDEESSRMRDDDEEEESTSKAEELDLNAPVGAPVVCGQLDTESIGSTQDNTQPPIFPSGETVGDKMQDVVVEVDTGDKMEDVIVEPPVVTELSVEKMEGEVNLEKSQEPIAVAATPSKKTSTAPSTPQSRRKPEYENVLIEFAQPVKYFRVAVPDSFEANIAQYFDNAIQFIQDQFTNKEEHFNCLVHCREGRSRSVSVLIAYGMKVLGMTLKEAVENITRKSQGRPRINDGFKHQLMKFELDLLQKMHADHALKVSLQQPQNPEDPTSVTENLPESTTVLPPLENTYDFFSTRRDRKRNRNYIEEANGVDLEDDDEYYEPAAKRRKKRKTKKKKKALPPISGSILDFFGPNAKKQKTLFDMFKKPAPKPVPQSEPAVIGADSPVVNQQPSSTPALESSSTEATASTDGAVQEAVEVPKETTEPAAPKSAVKSTKKKAVSTKKGTTKKDAKKDAKKTASVSKKLSFLDKIAASAPKKEEEQKPVAKKQKQVSIGSFFAKANTK